MTFPKWDNKKKKKKESGVQREYVFTERKRGREGGEEVREYKKREREIIQGGETHTNRHNTLLDPFDHMDSLNSFFISIFACMQKIISLSLSLS